MRDTKYARSRKKFAKYFREVPKVSSKKGRNSTVINKGMYSNFLLEVANCPYLSSDPEAQALILVLYSTGIRINEALKIKVSQVDILKKRIRGIKLSKKRRDFFMDKPLHPNCLFKLESYLEGMDQDSDLFPTITDRFKARRRVKAYLGQDMTTHDTRHGWISRAVNEGNSKGEKYTEIEITKMVGFQRLDNATTYLNVETDSLMDEMFEEVA